MAKGNNKRLSISLDEEAAEVVAREAGDNKSAFISAVLKDWRDRRLEEQLRRQLLEDAEDEDLIAEMVLWEVTVGDGLDDEEAAE